MLRLPLKKNPTEKLGNFRRGALQMLLNTECRLERNPELKQNYVELFPVSLTRTHRDSTTSGEGGRRNRLYILYAGQKNGSKIRVVFNASFRTSSGASLNDLLLSGPKLQVNLWLVLTRWRFHEFAFTTDIVKMFRQIRIHPDDTNLQWIHWRAAPDSITAGLLTHHRLITYGTASAPLLSIRTLLQLTENEGKRYILEAVIHANTYMHDVLAGAGMKRALKIKRQTVELLEVGGFRLSK